MRTLVAALTLTFAITGCSTNPNTTASGQPIASDPSLCGLPPGAPAMTCSDGTLGGFTGQCLCDHNGNNCGWEFRDCPPAGECSKEACGVQPGLPAYTCDDGSIGGFTGQCLQQPGGSCGWEIRECPCTDAQCGPQPGIPTYTCGDGSTGGFTGECLHAADNSCHWEIRSCP